MKVTFHGVRGSVPAPGPSTVRYGGNTSCVSVRLSDDSLVILDAGTGIRTLGNDLAQSSRPTKAHLLLSHTHWDHILGLPFFGPLWRKDTELSVYPLSTDAQERFQRTIFDDIHFPVSAADIPAKVRFEKPTERAWRIGSAKVSRIALNHPGGSQGFRIDDDDGSSFAYLTDNELGDEKGQALLDELARFADGVSLLAHDSQYLAQDMPAKRGWGHSVVEDVLRLAVMSAPKTVALYHHDPDREDAALDRVGAEARHWLTEHASATDLIVASEGLALSLEPR